MKTYTKILVAAVMGTYFFGVAYGAVFCFCAGAYLGEYLSFIGVPTATAIGFYCWKAKAENMVKFRKEAAQEEPQKASQEEEDNPAHEEQEKMPSYKEILEELAKEEIL